MGSIEPEGTAIGDTSIVLSYPLLEVRQTAEWNDISFIYQ